MQIQTPKVKLRLQVVSGAVPNCMPIRCYAKLFPDKMLNGKPDGSNLNPQPLSQLTRYGGLVL